MDPRSPFPSFSLQHWTRSVSSLLKYFLLSTSPMTHSCLDLPLSPWLLLLLCCRSAVRLPQGCPEPTSPHRALGGHLPCSLSFHLHTNGPSGLLPAQSSLPALDQIIRALKMGSVWRSCTSCSPCPKSTVASVLCPPPHPSLLTPIAQLGIPTHSLPQARRLGSTPECFLSSWLSSLNSCQSVPSNHAGTQASFRSFRFCLCYTLSVPQTSPSPLQPPRTLPFRAWVAMTGLCHQPPEIQTALAKTLFLRAQTCLAPTTRPHLPPETSLHPLPALFLCLKYSSVICLCLKHPTPTVQTGKPRHGASTELVRGYRAGKWQSWASKGL